MQTLRVNISRIFKIKNEIFRVLFSYEPEHIVKLYQLLRSSRSQMFYIFLIKTQVVLQHLAHSVVTWQTSQIKGQILLISSSSHKTNMLKIWHYKTIYFLRYMHPKYMKCLFTNIQKQQNMLKTSLLFKKNANFTGKYLKNF